MDEPLNEPITPNASHETPQKAGRREPRWRHPAVIVFAGALLFLGWQWHDTRNELRRTQEEMARRLTEGGTAAQESRTLARQSQENVQALQNKIAVLEARIAESQGQQAALESLYQEFSRARDERALADVQQAVDIASQQLQLASNVPAAVAALQSADEKLALLDRPQLLPLRKLIARDIERLKALPLADVANMSLQLDAMLGRVDNMPMGFEHRPIVKPAPTAQPKKAGTRGAKNSKKAVAEVSAPASAPVSNETPQYGAIGSFFEDLWAQLRQLIRIERLDRPDPALLAPTHAAYLRENIRLRLLSARLALLQRDSKVFNEDIRQARVWIERYFDVSAPVVENMLNDLRRIEGSQLHVELPSLTETEAALRGLKIGMR